LAERHGVTRKLLILPALLALAALAGCGADGEPVTPGADATVGGDASGVSTTGKVKVHKGPLVLGVSL
jgi:predicted small lipoprotein YifL